MIQRLSKVWRIKLLKKLFKKVIKKGLVFEGNRRRRRPEPVKLLLGMLTHSSLAFCSVFVNTSKKSVLADETHGYMQVTSHDRAHAIVCFALELSSYKSRSVGYGSMATKRKEKMMGKPKTTD